MDDASATPSELTICDLTITVHDDQIDVDGADGSRHVIPVGPRSLTETEFGSHDPPPPACLTNALGLVHDHLDDVVIDSADVAGARSVRFVGHHTHSLACVEIGGHDVPPGYVAGRAQLDELFRTLVAESSVERGHNPGLDAAHNDTVIATCCVVLAIMRRLALHEACFDDHPEDTDEHRARVPGSVS